MTFIAICDSFEGKFEEALEYAERTGVFSAFGEPERKRIFSIASPHARELSLRALIALKFLCDKAGLPADALEIKRKENGKPFFISTEYSFSLSHSGTLAVAALSCEEIGVDIEKIVERPSPRKLADRFFCEGEREYYEKSGGSLHAFYRVWTAKEALVKRGGKALAQSATTDDTCALEETGEERFYRAMVSLGNEAYFMTVSLKNNDVPNTFFINCKPNITEE